MPVPALYIFQTRRDRGYLITAAPFSLKEYWAKRCPVPDFFTQAEQAAAKHIGKAYLLEKFQTPAPHWADRKIKSQIEALLAARKISRRHREIIILYYIEGKNLKEIAALKHIKSSTASVNKKLALEKIRTFFDYEIQNYYLSGGENQGSGNQYLKEENVRDFLIQFIHKHEK